MNQNQIDSTISKIPTKASSSAPFSQSSSISAQSYATISWKEASKKNPCPLCGKPDWCSVAENDSAVLCRRTDHAPMGWKHIKDSSDGYPIYVKDDSRDRSNPTRRVIHTRRRSKPKSAPSKAPPINLARLPEPVTHPEKQKRGEQAIIRYPYSDTQWVKRIESADSEKAKGYSKVTIPRHRNAEGKSANGKGDKPWDAYRLSEVIAHGADQWVLGVEGETCVEAARHLGLVSFTFQGGSWSGGDLGRFVDTCKQAGIKGIAYFPDHDSTGIKKAAQLSNACELAQLPFVSLNPNALWSECPDKGDIADWVKWGMEQDWDKEEFIRRLEETFHSSISVEEEEGKWDEDIPSTSDSLSPKETFVQFTLDALYGDKPWICVNGKLYYWTGTYYKHSEDGLEIRRLADWCDTYIGQDKKGQLIYPYAKPSKVKEALEWIKMKLWVSSSQINPPGLNCTNGVLSIEWEGSTPTWKLTPHTPDLYYIYKPLVKYDPDANNEFCSRLLEALDAPQQDIFLKTIAASLDLATVRKFKGRLVRGLILKGHGSNGKDTLREIVKLLYGRQGLTGCTLSDFAAYDSGRKFTLSRLRHSRVNWASENANTAQLDKIQSLKAFITGDSISSERKGKDEEEFEPAAIALFNANDTPKLQGVLEAIAGRYGILSFNKTFKIGADKSKGELEADPRFKYDPDFLQSEVLPTFLNRVLDALSRLMSEGIDYSCTQKALEDIQAENSHLFQFAQDTGLGYNPNSTLTAREIWGILEQWYLDNGTLTYLESTTGSSKAVWMEQASPYDRNVKGANQVLGRFQKLFPKAKRVVVPSPDGKSRHAALKGLGFNSSPPPEEPPPGGEPPPDPVPTQPRPSPDPIPDPINNEKSGVPTHPTQFSHPSAENQNALIAEENFSDFGNPPKSLKSDTPQTLGRVGRDDQISTVSGSVTGSETEPTGSETEPTGSEDAIASPSTQPTPAQNDSGENAAAKESAIDYKNVIAAIDREMKRLGWKKQQGRDYLINKYGSDSFKLNIPEH